MKRKVMHDLTEEQSLEVTDKWMILFDLDQTLVLTSEIEHLRKRRLWQQVYRSFYKTKLPPGTYSFLESIQMVVGPLGVVTTSPRPYAEKLLAYHRLEIPVLIAYHDVARRKPYPDPILRAVEKFRLSPEQCIYIGDQSEDILAAVSAGAIPIGLSWDGLLNRSSEAPLARVVCNNWDEVRQAVLNIVKS